MGLENIPTLITSNTGVPIKGKEVGDNVDENKPVDVYSILP